jgi:hypothetical protein
MVVGWRTGNASEPEMPVPSLGYYGKHSDAVFGKVDTQAQPELAAAFGISSIPMLVRRRLSYGCLCRAVTSATLEAWLMWSAGWC